MRMSLARAMGREEKASMFHDTRESVGLEMVSTLRGVREAGVRERLWVTWHCALLERMGAQRRAEWWKAERVRQSLLGAMVVSGLARVA